MKRISICPSGYGERKRLAKKRDFIGARFKKERLLIYTKKHFVAVWLPVGRKQSVRGSYQGLSLVLPLKIICQSLSNA